MKDTRQPRHTHCIRSGCGKLRRRPKGRWAIDVWLDDGFCSTECAKAHYGVSVQPSAPQIYLEREFDQQLAETA